LELSSPERVSFDENYKLSFIVAKASNTVPRDVKVVLRQGGYVKEWMLEELDSSKKFEINLQGKDLGVGSNELEIKVSSPPQFKKPSSRVIINSYFDNNR